MEDDEALGAWLPSVELAHDVVMVSKRETTEMNEERIESTRYLLPMS